MPPYLTNDGTSYWDKMSYFKLLCICQVGDLLPKGQQCPNPEQCLSEALAENARLQNPIGTGGMTTHEDRVFQKLYL